MEDIFHKSILFFSDALEVPIRAKKETWHDDDN